ncbi:PREDICTED: kelch repeat and BTB domain-containing protein 2-like [Branchiostoma belcheri]|uniref:Kelch repeat and BTB domain-containing protein 2-like n=1 Tax=Branchiostoma belcheri TaxID=7741 RepID=A0A6P4Y316_BRABE|nr:PREDICTED: kelch repeat and BTB domain-containing protein 2-like [Branchiostoma belcheri]
MNVTNPEYPRAVLKELNRQRKKGELTDVVLEVEGRSFPCHRAILISCSPYFRAMLTSGYAESKQDKITIRDVSKVVMATILDYAYTGCLQTKPDQVQAVMSAARLLQLDYVYSRAANYMKAHLDLSNCADVLMYADTLADSGLVESTEIYIASRFNKAVLQPSFLQLSLPRLQSLLNRDDLITQSEDDVVQAALKWINYNQAERSQHLPALCKTLRYPSISSTQREEIERRRPTTDSTLVYSESTTQRLGQEQTEMQIVLKRVRDEESEPFAACHDPATGTYYAIKLPDGQISMVATPDGDLYLAADSEGREYCGQRFEIKKEKKFYLYNHLLRTWEPKCRMIKHRARYELVSLNGYIYAIGGDTKKGRAERYDPNCDEWTSIPPFPHPVSSKLCAVTLNDNIYIIGGDSEGCYRFSTTENQWDRIADMIEPQPHPLAVTYQGSIYCVNWLDSGNSLPTVEAYDPADGMWKRTGNGTSIVLNKKPTKYVKATLMTHGETLHLFTVMPIECRHGSYYIGCDHEPEYATYVHQYQPETDTWVSEESTSRIRLFPPENCLTSESSTDFLAARMIPKCLENIPDIEDYVLEPWIGI